jgi:formate hydrogenlyase subunit 4
MSAYVTDQDVHKTVQSKQFALPLNENTDISNEAQLVTFMSSSRNCGNTFYFVGSSREMQLEESFLTFSLISIISSGSGVKVTQKR